MHALARASCDTMDRAYLRTSCAMLWVGFFVWRSTYTFWYTHIAHRCPAHTHKQICASVSIGAARSRVDVKQCTNLYIVAVEKYIVPWMYKPSSRIKDLQHGTLVSALESFSAVVCTHTHTHKQAHRHSRTDTRKHTHTNNIHELRVNARFSWVYAWSHLTARENPSGARAFFR